MKKPMILPVGSSPAVTYAALELERSGYLLTDAPAPEVTHILLDVPCRDSAEELTFLLQRLPESITAIGGNLPALPCRCIDLLQDPGYLAENAAITAHCALRLILDALPVTLQDLPVLIVGWGRIGKCLAALLRAVGAHVTVAARKETDRAMLTALGYGSCPIVCDNDYRVIVNTVPEMVLPQCPEGALKLDLASRPGLGGQDVISARGLPGKYAPESAGKLIAKTILNKLKSEDIL